MAQRRFVIATVSASCVLFTVFHLFASSAPAQPAGEKTFTNSSGMEFVLIPAGTFMMGDADGEADERPAHQVTISRPFYLGKYEVTQAQWHAIMGNNPSLFTGTPNLPVEQVWWTDVEENGIRGWAANGRGGRAEHAPGRSAPGPARCSAPRR